MSRGENGDGRGRGGKRNDITLPGKMKKNVRIKSNQIHSHLSKPRPFRMRGPKVFVTEAPALMKTERATQR